MQSRTTTQTKWAWAKSPAWPQKKGTKVLKLNQPNIETVEVRRDLPPFLAGGEACYIKIVGLPASRLNLAYVRASDRLVSEASAYDKRLESDLKDLPPDEAARRRKEARLAGAAMRVGALYDGCVVEWLSNILDDGNPIACDKEHFLALAEVPLQEIAAAIMDFERECIDAGRAIDEAEGELEGN